MRITKSVIFPMGRVVVACAALGMLASCDSGSTDSPSEIVLPDCFEVKSEFKGDLEATYQDGGGGPGDGSAGDAGSAGAGAGEGKVLKGRMIVTRLSDGAPLGEAETDPVNGLVTIRTCGKPVPMLLTLKGQTGAKYFDEGKNELVDFGPDKELHALVPGLYENVGVSAFTEAAYRYAVNNFLSDPAKVADGTTPLRAKADGVTGLMEKVEAANKIVLDEVNRKLPTGYQLTTLTALPTPIDARSNPDALSDSRYGVAAVVTGGFAWMANQFNRTAVAPALVATEEIANDLTDGKIDGYALNGRPASVALSDSSTVVAAYDSSRLPVALQIGSNAVASVFSLANIGNAPKFADITQAGSCYKEPREERTAVLGKDSSVKVVIDSCRANVPLAVKTLFNSGIVQMAKAEEGFYLLKSDGTALASGRQHCGALGDGQDTSATIVDPASIPGLTNITSLASGYGYALARDSSGKVWSWGHNSYGNLGRTLDALAPHCRLFSQNDPLPYSSAPAPIPGLSDIVSIYASDYSAWAIDKSGALFQWGFTGTNDAGIDKPIRVEGLGPVRTVTYVSTLGLTFALQKDGTVMGWGRKSPNPFVNGAPDTSGTPKPVPGISGVRLIATDHCSVLALLADGRVMRWGGCVDASKVSQPTEITELSALTKGIRHMIDANDATFLFTQEGDLLVYGDQFGPNNSAGVRELDGVYPVLFN